MARGGVEVQLWLLRALGFGLVIHCKVGIRTASAAGPPQTSRSQPHGFISEFENTSRIWGEHGRRKDGVLGRPHPC